MISWIVSKLARNHVYTCKELGWKLTLVQSSPGVCSSTLRVYIWNSNFGMWVDSWAVRTEYRFLYVLYLMWFLKILVQFGDSSPLWSIMDCAIGFEKTELFSSQIWLKLIMLFHTMPLFPDVSKPLCKGTNLLLPRHCHSRLGKCSVWNLAVMGAMKIFHGLSF